VARSIVNGRQFHTETHPNHLTEAVRPITANLFGRESLAVDGMRIKGSISRIVTEDRDEDRDDFPRMKLLV
jgi:hypothetical protein